MIPVSIIVPVYNVERYICRCIDSILNQTFVNYELILVEDGSPDNSAYICDEYAKSDERISVIHKENGGLSSARNAGIDAAKGEYLFFVDGDDVIHPNTLNIFYNCIKKNNSEIVVSNFERFQDDSEIVFNGTYGDFEMISGICALERIYDNRYDTRYISVCGKLIKRTLFEGIKFPLGRIFEDEFIIHLLFYKSERVWGFESKFYYYYMDREGITGNLTLQKWFDEYDAQWARILFFKERGLDIVYHKALLTFLNSAQWHLKAFRDKTENVYEMRGRNFEKQYESVLRLAQKENILSFWEHYDYYVLGNPKKVWYYRIKRIVMNGIKRLESIFRKL